MGADTECQRSEVLHKYKDTRKLAEHIFQFLGPTLINFEDVRRYKQIFDSQNMNPIIAMHR